MCIRDRSRGIISLKACLAKIIDSPTKIKTSGVKVSFSREIKSVIIAGISFTLNPKESIIIDIAKTALIGSRKIFFKIDLIEILFFLFFIPWVDLCKWKDNPNRNTSTNNLLPKSRNDAFTRYSLPRNSSIIGKQEIPGANDGRRSNNVLLFL